MKLISPFCSTWCTRNDATECIWWTGT